MPTLQEIIQAKSGPSVRLRLEFSLASARTPTPHQRRDSRPYKWTAKQEAKWSQRRDATRKR